MKRAFVFPGQGSQKIGMGKELYDAFPAAKHVFQEVDEALSQDLSGLIFSGNEKDLTMTENTQPALMAVSLAAVRVMETELKTDLADHCAYVAGHSLGEYSALAAVKSFDLGTTAKLLRIRGQAMQAAVPVGKGAMAALIGVDFATAQEIVTAAMDQAGNDHVCVAANDNAPGQVVISGTTGAVEIATVIAKERGAKRALMLPVSAPFHSPLIQSAADKMAQALSQEDVRPPKCPIICNVTAQPESEPSQIRRLLVDQVTGTVRWRESVETMAGLDVTQIVEVGAGKVLTGLARRINPDLQGVNVETPADIEAFLKTL